MQKYYTIFTNTGLAKVANAQITDNKLEITHMAFGDAQGEQYDPIGDETTLRNEVWRTTASVELSAENPNWFEVVAVIPAEVGGFTVREVGLYDVDGDLVGIGNYPETPKPVIDEGSIMDLIVRMVMAPSNIETIDMTLDPTIATASRKYVAEQIDGVTSQLAHTDAELLVGVVKVVDELPPDAMERGVFLKRSNGVPDPPENPGGSGGGDNTGITVIRPTGTANDSPYLNTMFAKGGRFLIKNGVYNIDEDVRITMSNCEITFELFAALKKTATSRIMYFMLDVFNVENIVFNNLRIIGDKDIHLGTDGEWGYGIHLCNVDNVILNNPDIKKCWGDGIYIGNKYGTVVQRTSGRIIINNALIDDCRRQGISVGSVKHLEIHGGKISNIGGTAPGAGVQMEPEGDVNPAFLDYVLINDLITENCAGGGINMYLPALANRGLTSKVIINNHVDNGSKNGFSNSANPANIKGEIILNNPNYSFNKATGITVKNNRASSLDVIINNPIIKNPNVANNVPGELSAGISIFSDRIDEATDAFANVIVKNPIIVDDRATPLMSLPVYVQPHNPSIAMQDVSVLDPIKIRGVKQRPTADSGLLVSDSYSQFTG